MFNIIAIKISTVFLTEIEKSFLKFILKQKRPQIAKIILSKNSKAGAVTVPAFKLFYKAIATKNHMALAPKQTSRPMEMHRRTTHKPTQLQLSDF
jgi:hypothetical protein